MPETQTTFPFFSLPREVRDHILHYHTGNKHIMTAKRRSSAFTYDNLIPQETITEKFLLLEENPITLNSTHQFTISLLTALRVSHQFYDEALTAFYTTSDFTFKCYKPLYDRFLTRVPLTYQNQIQNLYLQIWPGQYDEWREALQQKAGSCLIGLRKIAVVVEVPMLKGPPFGCCGEVSFGESEKLPMLREGRIAARDIPAMSWYEAYSQGDVERMLEGLAATLR